MPLWLALVLLAFASASSHARPSDPPQSTSAPSLVKTLGQEIGSPSELAWQAWLLVESKGGISSALDSSNILRRITPKSIFIAPELISCPSGYSTDGRGSCRPDPIVIDEVAQKQFFLKRLNALYGKLGANKKKPEAAPPPPPQGPLQINIPISLPKPSAVDEQSSGNKTQETVATVVIYKVENDTRKDEESTGESFLLGSSNSAANKVAEIVVESAAVNDTFDYKINSTKSEDSSATVVLLLSPTKLPSTTEKPSTTTTTTTEEPMTTETTTTAMPTTVVVADDEAIQTVAPLMVEDVETESDATFSTTERVPSTARSRDEYERRDQQMTTTTSPAPSTSSADEETAYTDDDDEETQTPEQESTEEEEEEYEDEFAEDELLKPGEAGSMLSAKNQELIRSKTTAATIATTVTVQDTTTIPPSTIADVMEAKESTIRAEVTSFFTAQTTTTTDVPSTIVVEETTTTPRAQRITATIQIDPRPIPATTRRPTTANPTESPAFFLHRQPQQQQKPPSFTVNDEPPIFFGGNRRDHLPPEFKDQLPPRTYVRFPESAPLPPHNRGYVRFPSDDVNSIHNNQDALKDLSPFQYSSSTKSSVQRWRQQQKQKPMLLRFWARMPLVRDLSFYPTTSHGSHNEPIGGPTPPTARRGDN